MDVASVLSVGDALKRTIVYVALLGACSCSLNLRLEPAVEVKVGDEVGSEVGAMVGVMVGAEVEVEACSGRASIFFQYFYEMLDASNL